MQATDVGNVVIREDAPVVQILTSATKGVIATPDADKWFLRRWPVWVPGISQIFLHNTCHIAFALMHIHTHIIST